MKQTPDIKAVAWKAYETQISASPRATAASKRFDDVGLHFGNLSPDFASKLGQAIVDSPRDPMAPEDVLPGFVSFEFLAPTVQKINRNSLFRRPGTEATWMVNDLTDMLKDDVAECLGSPWTVHCVRAWTTPPCLDDQGMYGWHSDHFIPEIFKIMIYLVPLNEEWGGFQFRIQGEDVTHRSEQAGAWALFKNTAIEHRGVPGTRFERIAIELTIARSATFDLRPRFVGQNSHWPEFPFIGQVPGLSSDTARVVSSGLGAPHGGRGLISRLVRPNAA